MLMQIVQIAPSLGQHAVEISLSPEELGTLRLSLTAAEGALSLSISADRAETLELLRRHASDLGEQFSALGFENVEFQFHHNGRDEAPSETQALMDDGGAASTEDPNAPDGIARMLTVARSGLDLRL